MKNIWTLFKLDWKRIFHNKLTFMLMIALMFIPSLYAWFNIGALWDPYSNTGDIKIAVYSADKPVEVMGEEVNIGHDIIENLKENDAIDWQFVHSKQELDDGVKSGKYYGSLYIPPDFSKDIVSFINGDIKYPEIVYSVNQKINAIAPKISDKGAETVQQNVSQEFIETVTNSLMEVLNEIGFNLDANLPSIRKLTSRILLIDDNMSELNQYMDVVVDLNNRVPEFEDKLDKANQLTNQLPTLNAQADKLLLINNYWPEIDQVGLALTELQMSAPMLLNLSSSVDNVNQTVGDLGQLMGNIDQQLYQASGVVTDVRQFLPQLQTLIDQTDQMIPEIEQELNRVISLFPVVASSVDTGLYFLTFLSDSTYQFTENLLTTLEEHPTDTAVINEIFDQLNELSNQLTKQLEVLDHVIYVLTAINDLSTNAILSSLIQSLESIENKMIDLNQLVIDSLLQWDQIKDNPKNVKDLLVKINRQAKNINQLLQRIDLKKESQKIMRILDQVSDTLSKGDSAIQWIQLNAIVPRIDSLMESTQYLLSDVSVLLTHYQGEIPHIQELLSNVSGWLNMNIPVVISGIDKTAMTFNNELPVVKQKVARVTNFVEKDFPNIEQNLLETMDNVNKKAPELKEALATATSLIDTDWPKMQEKMNHLADLIRKGESNIDLNEVVHYLKSDAKAESEFLSNPIHLKTKDVYPVPNYGSASTPFYTALCLWVGAILFSSIASTKFHLSPKQQKIFTLRQQFVARMLTFYVVGFFQTMIVILGNQFLLGTYTKDRGLNILFALLIGWTFMTMVYVLVALFGNLGKGIAVIILVLSISAGAGNFPIEMSGPFFRKINPYIPFTHAVNLLRESVGGVYWPTAIKAMIILVSIAIVFIILGISLYPKADRIFEPLNRELKKGHILH